MSGTDDLLLDRRVLRRRLSRWRLLALLALVALGVLLLPGAFDGSLRPHVARVKISGVIVADDDQVKLLNRLAEDDMVSAVILDIDSPGGTTVGGESLYKAIRQISANKPVVASIGTLGTSAAYLIATAADRIYAYESSLTGSIGVLIQAPDFSRLMDQVGIAMNEIKSAPLKAAPSPFKTMSPAAEAALQGVINDSFAWFKGLVAERRGLSGDALAKVTDGRIFTGRQALDLKLVDALGAEAEILDWLRDEKGLPAGMPVIDMDADDFDVSTVLSGKAFVPKWLTLDGLTSVWHPRLD